MTAPSAYPVPRDLVVGQPAVWDFFIAHASKDTAAARALHDAIDRRYRVFLDDVERQPGDDFDIVICAAQHGSRVTVVLVSSSADEAFYAREALATAISLSLRYSGAHRFVPVYLDRGPEELHEVPYGLRLKHGLVLASDGGFPGVAQRLKAQLGPTRAVGAPAGGWPTRVLQTAHPLHRYPRGPMVDARHVPRGIIEAFAHLLCPADAESVIDDANAFRASANGPSEVPGLIERRHLPDPSVVNPYAFWYYAFTEARLNGPRMLAALLLTVPADRFPVCAAQDREALLRWLEVGSEHTM